MSNRIRKTGEGSEMAAGFIYWQTCDGRTHYGYVLSGYVNSENDYDLRVVEPTGEESRIVAA